MFLCCGTAAKMANDSDACYSATSVDVEEHLYRLAKEKGITVLTSSQVRITDSSERFVCWFQCVNMLFVSICPDICFSPSCPLLLNLEACSHTIPLHWVETDRRWREMGVMLNIDQSVTPKHWQIMSSTLDIQEQQEFSRILEPTATCYS